MRYDFITKSGEKQICFLAIGINGHIAKPADMKILEKFFVTVSFIIKEEFSC